MRNLKNHLLLNASATQFKKGIYTLAYSFILIGSIIIDIQAQSENSKSIPVIAAQVKAVKPPSTDSYTSVRCTLQDKAGNLWFGTTGAGVYRYDPSASLRAGGKSFTNFTEKDGLMNKVVYSIIEDKSGNIWASTEDGVYRYNGKKFSHFPLAGIDNINYNFFHKPPVLSASLKIVQHPNPIYSMIQDKIGNIWFGTGKYGLVRYNGSSFTNFNYFDGQWHSVPKDSIIVDDEYYRQAIQYLHEDSRGNVIFSSMSYGLFSYDGKTVSRLKADKPLKGVYAMTEDKKGNLWFDSGELSVSSFDGKSLKKYTEKDGLCGYYIVCLLGDSKGNVWFGSTYRDEKGRTQGCLTRYDGKTINQFPLEGLDNTSITNIFEDRSGNIWIGSRNVGIYKYDGRTITDFTEKGVKQ
jgi:ligand-binding sensor domain-containing protein